MISTTPQVGVVKCKIQDFTRITSDNCRTMYLVDVIVKGGTQYCLMLNSEEVDMLNCMRPNKPLPKTKYHLQITSTPDKADSEETVTGIGVKGVGFIRIGGKG